MDLRNKEVEAGDWELEPESALRREVLAVSS
jgi:hypothetical protein